MPTKAKVTSNEKPSTPVEYEALVGMNYGDRRVEEGEIVDDLPEESVKWLLEQGHIRKVEE